MYNKRHICSHTRTLAQVNTSMQIPYSSLNFPHATHKAVLSLCSNGCLFSSGRYVPLGPLLTDLVRLAHISAQGAPVVRQTCTLLCTKRQWKFWNSCKSFFFFFKFMKNVLQTCTYLCTNQQRRFWNLGESFFFSNSWKMTFNDLDLLIYFEGILVCLSDYKYSLSSDGFI